MKLKLGDLFEINRALGELMAEKLPIKTSYWLNKFVKNQLSKEIQSLTDTRNEVINKYCDKDEHGQPIVENYVVHFTPENEAAANQELTVLMTEEIEMEFNPILISDLTDVKISPTALNILTELGFIEGDMA